jgi:hypothetical protein
MVDFDPAVADKDQLVKFAKDNYQITIDPRTKIETIRLRVENLIAGIDDVQSPSVAEVKKADALIRFVKSTVNDNVYEWHPGFVGCDWLIPCDAAGTVV